MNRIGLAIATVSILLGLSVCAVAQPAADHELTRAQEMELELFQAQLLDPARSHKTKRDAAALLLSREYPQAGQVLRKFLTDASNRPAQIAVAAAIAENGGGDASFVEPLLDMLTGDEATVRVPAGQALATYKDQKVTRKLIDVARDRKLDQAVRLVAVQSLSRVLDKQAVDALVQLLDDNDAVIRSAAADSLAALTNIRHFGTDRTQWRQWWARNANKPRSVWLADLADSLGQAKTVLEKENAELKGRLAAALTELYSVTPAARRDALLMSFLKDRLANVRRVGMDLVGRRLAANEELPAELREQVLSMISDTDPGIRSASALLVGTLGDTDSVPTLLSRLKVEEDLLARRGVVTALGRLRAIDATDPVMAEVSSADVELATAATTALARLVQAQPLSEDQAAQAVTVLTRRWDKAVSSPNGNQLREELLVTMGVVGDKKFVPVLEGALDAEAATVRLAAVKGLVQLGQPSSAQAVEPLLADPDRGVRQAALMALGKLDGQRYLTALLQRTDPKTELDATVRRHAWEVALELLDTADAAVLVSVAESLADREDAANQRIRVLQRLVALHKASKSDKLAGTLRQLGRALSATGRSAEAAPHFQEAAKLLADAKSDQAGEAWLEWIEALLAADDPGACKAIAQQTDATLFAEAVQRLQQHLDAMAAARNWQTVISQGQAALTQVDGRMTDAQRGKVAEAVSNALAKQAEEDERRVATLTGQLTSSDPSVRRQAESALISLGDRAVKPLVQELGKLLQAETAQPETEKAILAVLQQLAPGFTGYDLQAAKTERVKVVQAWLTKLRAG